MSKSERQKEQRELKEARLKADAEEHAKERRSNLLKLAGGGILFALIIVGIAIAISQSGESKKQDVKVAGIPQNGFVLGKPNAPVQVVEFGDLQCPFCKKFAETVTPKVISGPIKAGKANIEYQNFIIIGPDSVTAAYASYAASEQNKYWEFIEAFYAEQKTENSGYVTDEFLTQVAKDAGVPDIAKWDKDRANTAKWDKVAAKSQAQGKALGVQGTPSFAVGTAGSPLKLVTVQTSQDLIDAINQAGK